LSENAENETHYSFEETDVLVPERDGMREFVDRNLGNLFELGIAQTQQNDLAEENRLATDKYIRDGSLPAELKMLGQQITALMLEVM
jgi:hypothetical protein